MPTRPIFLSRAARFGHHLSRFAGVFIVGVAFSTLIALVVFAVMHALGV